MKPTREEINEMRLKAFVSNNQNDRMAYYKACSGWFQDDDYQQLERAEAVAALQSERDAAIARAEKAEAALAKAWEIGRNDAAEKAKLVVCYQHGPYTESGHMWSLGNLAYVEASALTPPADLVARLTEAKP